MTIQKLTLKQEKFCQEYIILGDASAAYRIAFDAKNMKDNTVNVTACNLLKNPKVAIRVKELKEKQSVKYEITKDKIVNEYATLAFKKIKKYTAKDKRGALDSLSKIFGYMSDRPEKAAPITLHNHIHLETAAIDDRIGEMVNKVLRRAELRKRKEDK